MASGSGKRSGKDDDQMPKAFRKLYQAISEVSHYVGSLNISDQAMDSVMDKMDRLHEAYFDLKRTHSHNASLSVSHEHVTPRKCHEENASQEISSLKKILLSQKEQINALSKESADFKRNVAAVARTAAKLSTDQRDIQKRVVNSEHKVNDLVCLQVLLNDLHMNVDEREELSSRVKEQNGLVRQIEKELMKTNEAVSSLQHAYLDKWSDSGHALVAFNAKALTISPRKYKRGDTVEFKDDVLNVSSCYDRNTSTFTAPVDGMYFFASSVNLNTASFFAAAITNSAGEELALFASPPIKDIQTSTSVLTALSKGDKVWVKVYRMSSPSGVEPGSVFSNFMGFQIR